MRPLSTAELLEIWDRGQALPLARRALLLLSAAEPETAPGQLARLSVGERDRRLLLLRGWAFGARIAALARCPACAELAELSFDMAGLLVEAVSADVLSVCQAGCDVQFRLPNSLDLLCLDPRRDGDANRELLLERCVLAAMRGGVPVAAGSLPDAVINAVVGRMAEADPLADIALALNCPACRHTWLAPFDIVSFFWNEINAWARRTLHDVHLLASTYGWREADILELSPGRRQAYLELVHG